MKALTSKYFDGDGNLILVPYRLKDFSAIYGVSNRTMKKWIEEAAPLARRTRSQYYLIPSVIIIIEALGLPQTIETKRAA